MRNKQKRSLSKIVMIFGITLIIGMAGFTTLIDIIGSYRSLNIYSANMRADYTAREKQMIKQEVFQVVDLISHERAQKESVARKQVRQRVNEAYAMAENIYNQNLTSHSRSEIQQMILDALRPIRYNQGSGYFFATRMDGREMLFADRPDLEGTNLLHSQDTDVRTVCQEMIRIAADAGEGFYKYQWTKPDTTGTDFNKIAFIKYFEPLDWFIGSGLYLSDVETQIKQDLLAAISEIRYGKEGYIFVNRLNGDALVSSGILFDGKRKLWEVFDEKPEEIKALFQKEYNAAQNPTGDYIYYSFLRLSDSRQITPKVSFIYGIPDLNWLVGSGVYLDDVEESIALMQSGLHQQIKNKILLLAIIPLGLIIIMLVLFTLVNQRLKNDLKLFLDFLKRATISDIPIDRNLVHFEEADRLAKHANQMLSDRIQSRLELDKEREALRQSEQKYRGLVESSSDWIWEVDTDGVYTFVSPQVEQILGYRPEAIIGKEFFEFMPEEEKERMEQIFRDLIATRTPLITLENIALHRDGRQVVLETSGVPVFDANDQLVGYRGVDRDITKRKKAEEELQKMQMLQSVGVLAGGIAHDFNNIMMGLFGNISLAKEALPQGHESRKALKDAENAMSRAIRLTKQLLTFSKGGTPLKEQVNLGDLVQEIVHFDLSGSNIKPVFDMGAGSWITDADKGQLQQVFSNLIINAKQATPDGGQLLIAFKGINVKASTELPLEPGKYIKVTIQDEGVGIDKSSLKKIFNPYFTTKQTGSGLGLATAYSIIKQHGGTIMVDSELGKGACFSVYLPAAPAVSDSAVNRQKAENTILDLKGKILVMDDDEMICRIVTAILTRVGLEVTTAVTGQEAIALYGKASAEGEPFDLAILDLTVPGGKGGKEVIKEILRINPQAKAIVSSGYADDPVMANYADFGFEGVAAKPYTKTELLAIVGQLLAQ